jgi:hypothetical protein
MAMPSSLIGSSTSNASSAPMAVTFKVRQSFNRQNANHAPSNLEAVLHAPKAAKFVQNACKHIYWSTKKIYHVDTAVTSFLAVSSVAAKIIVSSFCLSDFKFNVIN